jgi:hypothetical protein
MLNDKTITTLFHPGQNRIEAVTIPIELGTNTLRFGVAGTSQGGEQLTTTDKFVINVE